MHISHLNIRNNTIRLENICMDIDHAGVFRISGNNGTGKTTLLEKLLFGHEYISFDSDDEKALYQKERFRLFSYVPQDIPAPEIKTSEYIRKWNLSITDEEIDYWLNRFSLEQGILEQLYVNLSGGEQVKIALLTAIIKNTPYYFFDEPSNHLDDSSTQILTDIMNELSAEHIVIFTSHDPRLCPKVDAEYYISENGLTCKKAAVKQKRPIINERVERTSFLLIGFHSVISPPFLITILCGFLFVISLLVFSEIRFREQMNIEDPPENNHIIVYHGYYDSLNRRYAQLEGLDIPLECENEYLTFKDIQACLLMDGVKAVFHWDEYYTRQITEKIRNNDEDATYYIAVPRFIVSDFGMISGVDLGLRYIEGRYPDDYTSEVAVSRRILLEQFGFSEEEVEDAIGRQILLSPNGTAEQFTIVGLCLYDYIIVSYEDNYNLGIVEIDKFNAESFFSALSAFRQNLNEDQETVYELILVTEPGKEKAVLNRLLSSFPSDNYYCAAFAETWIDWYNGTVYKSVQIINFAASFLFSVILWFINRNSLRKEAALLRDLENYYVNRRKILLVNIGMRLLFYIPCILLLIILCKMLSSFNELLLHFLAYDTALLFLPLILDTLVRVRRKNGTVFQ